MTTGYEPPTPDHIERAAKAFAELLLTDARAVEAMRRAIFDVADVVNDRISPHPPLAGADVVAFLRALMKALDDKKLQGDDGSHDFDISLNHIIFGRWW